MSHALENPNPRALKDLAVHGAGNTYGLLSRTFLPDFAPGLVFRTFVTEFPYGLLLRTFLRDLSACANGLARAPAGEVGGLGTPFVAIPTCPRDTHPKNREVFC